MCHLSPTEIVCRSITQLEMKTKQDNNMSNIDKTWSLLSQLNGKTIRRT